VADTQTDTHRQVGDLISPVSFLESRLKTGGGNIGSKFKTFP
jgi:hypothetical protein